MSTSLSLAQVGDAVLYKKAVPINIIELPEVQRLIDHMIALAYKMHADGIAAPQVFESKRLFILMVKPHVSSDKRMPLVIINPRIITCSLEQEDGWEGCLSIPGVKGLVPRFTMIKAEFMTRTGKKRRKIFKNFTARVFQHEYDHLEGLVFWDRTAIVVSVERRETSHRKVS
ncbi:MAG: peptide deformylase [bacterium]